MVDHVRAVAAVGEQLHALAAVDVVDLVVADVVGAIAIDVDAMGLVRAALDIVDVVAEPRAVLAIAGDAGHARWAVASGDTGERGQLVVDDAPMIAVDFLADRTVVAAAFDLQVGDHDPTAGQRVVLAVESGQRTGRIAARAAVDKRVLVRIRGQGDRAAAGCTGWRRARTAVGYAVGADHEAQEIPLDPLVEIRACTQDEEVPGTHLSPGAAAKIAAGLYTAERMRDVADDRGGVVAVVRIDENELAWIDREGVIGVRLDAIDHDLQRQRDAGLLLAERADLHGQLLDVRTPVRRRKATVVVDFAVADEDLDVGAGCAVAEIPAEHREIAALVVFAAAVRPGNDVGVQHDGAAARLEAVAEDAILRTGSSQHGRQQKQRRHRHEKTLSVHVAASPKAG